MSLDFTDIFCGAGGSSIGLVAAGLELRLAANHWDRAIETHSANFPEADHMVADVSNYDMRRMPRTQVLWASPECTWHSPAGGRQQANKIRAQLDLFEEYVPTDAGVRSRATAFDVIRAAEVHRYKVIIVENVVEFAAWEMFDWWLAGLRNLGYTCQLISVSAAHIGDATNAPAPQWRDRLYVYCTAKGVPVPDVTPRPTSWCETCRAVVSAVQSWRRTGYHRKVGKYRQQYDYRCPNAACRHSIIEPYVLPAASIIDWSDLGARIGDRVKPLAAKTMARIQAGLEEFTAPNTGDASAHPAMLVPAGGGWNTTATSVEHPLRTRTTRDIEGVCSSEPFVTMLRNHCAATGVDEPLLTMATARHHGVTVPPGSAVPNAKFSLVIPNRKAKTKTPNKPLLTQASAGPSTPAIDIRDCYFRMVKPRESARAQRFPDSYRITGNQSEQQMQAGNAVSSNVSQWLGAKTVQVLS
jgi:DNA (cytosine-5)-methyltransferase 1